MITDSADQNEVEFNSGDEAKRAFVEPEISEPVDVVESTQFFQIQIGATDNPGDIG